MNQFIYFADYILALNSNTMTVEKQENFKQNITDRKSANRIFEAILKAFFKEINKNNLSAEEAFIKIQNEFNALDFSLYLAEFSYYYDLIALIVAAAATKEQKDSETINKLKQFITVADSMNEEIKFSIYYAVLNRLVYGDLIIDNVDFTQNILQYLKNTEEINDEDKELSDIIYVAINNL